MIFKVLGWVCFWPVAIAGTYLDAENVPESFARLMFGTLLQISWGLVLIFVGFEIGALIATGSLQ